MELKLGRSADSGHTTCYVTYYTGDACYFQMEGGVSCMLDSSLIPELIRYLRLVVAINDVDVGDDLPWIPATHMMVHSRNGVMLAVIPTGELLAWAHLYITWDDGESMSFDVDESWVLLAVLEAGYKGED